MDCLIEQEQAPGRRIVRVIGQLTQAQVPALLQACADPRGPRVTVDLTDLISTDAVGLRALRRLRAAGAQLTNVPRYIEPTLDG